MGLPPFLSELSPLFLIIWLPTGVSCGLTPPAYCSLPEPVQGVDSFLINRSLPEPVQGVDSFLINGSLPEPVQRVVSLLLSGSSQGAQSCKDKQ